MMSSFLNSPLADLFPQGSPLIDNNLVFYAALGGVVLLLLLLVLRLSRRRRAPIDTQAGLIEKLADYPPAGPGAQRLFVQGQEVRLRLVVLAPLGKRPPPAAEDVESILEQALHGLGGIARQDRPRFRAWPGQLSQQGFAPTFFRLTHRPEAAGKPSPWILTAGIIRAGGQQLLLGLALCADGPNTLGNLTVQANEWKGVLSVGPRT